MKEFNANEDIIVSIGISLKLPGKDHKTIFFHQGLSGTMVKKENDSLYIPSRWVNTLIDMRKKELNKFLSAWLNGETLEGEVPVDFSYKNVEKED